MFTNLWVDKAVLTQSDKHYEKVTSTLVFTHKYLEFTVTFSFFYLFHGNNKQRNDNDKKSINKSIDY